MGTAYTPGLTVSPEVVVRKGRRLPFAGEVLVFVGDSVEAGTPVARASERWRNHGDAYAQAPGTARNR